MHDHHDHDHDHDCEDPVDLTGWLDADLNPFGVQVFDCRGFAGKMIAASGDPAMAATWAYLREQDGSQYRDRLPENAVNVDCTLSYYLASPPEALHQGGLFVSSTMEEKWDIYGWGQKLYCARSWAGSLEFVADASLDGNTLSISSVAMNPDPIGNDLSYGVRMVDYLVKSHVFGLHFPHPLPADFPRDNAEIASYCYGLYGKYTGFATYEDTSALQMTGPDEAPTAP
jgi:hypothetical protein